MIPICSNKGALIAFLYVSLFFIPGCGTPVADPNTIVSSTITPKPHATKTPKVSDDTSDSLVIPNRAQAAPSDVFDQFVFIGQGGGIPDRPFVGKMEDYISLNGFEPNQKVRILLYEKAEFMQPGDFYAEFFREVDSRGELTLTIKNGRGTDFVYVILDADTNKELAPNENNCPKRSWSQLQENTTATITFTDGTPLRLREKPSTVFGDVVAKVDEGTQVKVRNGPICSEEYFWWEVTIQRKQGWMAEGDGQVRFLKPVN